MGDDDAGMSHRGRSLPQLAKSCQRCRFQFGGNRNPLNDRWNLCVRNLNQIRRCGRSRADLIKYDSRADRQPIGKSSLDCLSLKRRQSPSLDERIQPDGIERREVCRQTFHATHAPFEVSRRAQLLAQHDLLKLF